MSKENEGLSAFAPASGSPTGWSYCGNSRISCCHVIRLGIGNLRCCKNKPTSKKGGRFYCKRHSVFGAEPIVVEKSENEVAHPRRESEGGAQ